jgi:molybdopterin-guanine dinucleotide biosynthesis protein A
LTTRIIKSALDLDMTQQDFALSRRFNHLASSHTVNCTMEFEGGGPLLKPLLLVGGQSIRMGSRKELLSFPDGRLAFEHSLETLHSAIPTATTIYISIHNDSQKEGFQFRLDDPDYGRIIQPSHDDHSSKFPELEILIDEPGRDIGPAAGMLAAYNKFPGSKWVVLACGYPLLPPPALQQLILEYQPPVTCLVKESGEIEPLIGIWDPEALNVVKENVESGKNELKELVREMRGKLVEPLRNEWIRSTNTKDEWKDAMTALL